MGKRTALRRSAWSACMGALDSAGLSSFIAWNPSLSLFMRPPPIGIVAVLLRVCNITVLVNAIYPGFTYSRKGSISRWHVGTMMAFKYRRSSDPWLLSRLYHGRVARFVRAELPGPAVPRY